jgi:PAS domain S-box-containing protein
MDKITRNELIEHIKILEEANASRIQIEEALRDSENRYRTLTENIAIGIFRTTPGPKGRLIDVNPAMVKMFGFENKKEFLKRDVAEFYQNTQDRLRYSEKISKEGFLQNEELHLKKKNGTPIIVSETSIAVRDKNGEVQYFDGIMEDITERKKAQEELLIQKTFFEKLFNSAPEAIALHDNDDLVVDVNDEFVKLFGYTREEAIGKPINDLIAPPELEEEAKWVSQTVIQGKRVELDTKRRRKDNTLIDVSILGAPIIHNGKQLGDYAIYRDITQRKKAEQDLLIQKTYFEKLFNSAPEAIVWHDNNDIIVNVNNEFTKLFGYSRDEAIGKPINDLVAPPDFLEEAVLLSQQVINGKRVEVDSKRKRKDGSLVDVWILGAPISHEGKQLGIYAIYRDISERKKAEEELFIQKTYLEKLLNSAPEAIVWHDNRDIIVNVNDEFTKMFGYSREEAIGKPINELVVPPQFRDEAALLSHKVIHGERVEVDSKRRRKDGTLFDVWILGAPIIHEGKQMGVFAIYRDITERKKAEEARIRSREEARMAREIQINLLPDSNPEIPGFDIYGVSIPAENVGGDYYDFIHLENHQLAIGLGDVSGKGLAAALVMSNLQATIRGQAMLRIKADECLQRANKLLFDSTDSKTFVSLFYGILDTKNHVISYANAGQNTPLLFSTKNIPIPLKKHGLALGIQHETNYELEKISLDPGDRLLIFSDGITEAMNKRLEEFGEKRLQQVVQEFKGRSAKILVHQIIEAINLHVNDAPQNDDRTLIVLIRKSN